MSSILRELERLQDRISLLGADDSVEKHALLARQDALRTRAARLAEDVDAACSTKDLLIHLASLRHRRDVLRRQRHGPGSPGPGQTSSQVDERIERIKSLLGARGIQVH
jgi:hypothetical protein